jgi:DNA-binding GntR family transcriptional regulator
MASEPVKNLSVKNRGHQMAERRFIEPLVQESTPSIIARRLREAISHGELAPGAQLGEAELAREMKVSRGPVREAMQRLTQEGLLVSIRNRGLFVIEMTDDDIKDMYVARTAVESAAGGLLIEGDHQAAGEELRNSVGRMEDAAAADDPAAMSEADLEFHEKLVALARSPHLSRMHNTLLTETRMCIKALQSTYQSTDARITEHRALADAIHAGDRPLMEKLLIGHQQDALDRLTAGRKESQPQ